MKTYFILYVADQARSTTFDSAFGGRFSWTST